MSHATSTTSLCTNATELFQHRDDAMPVVDPELKLFGPIWIPLTSIATTKGKDRYLSVKGQPPTLCSFDHCSKCRKGPDCDYLHVDNQYITSARQLLQNTECNNGCMKHGDFPSRQTDFPDFCARMKFVITSQDESKRLPIPSECIAATKFWQPLQDSAPMIITIRPTQICNAHQTKTCKFGVNCRDVHLCRIFWKTFAAQFMPNFKTDLCKSMLTTGACKFGLKCLFAHGVDELRPKPFVAQTAIAEVRQFATTMNDHPIDWDHILPPSDMPNDMANDMANSEEESVQSTNPMIQSNDDPSSLDSPIPSSEPLVTGGGGRSTERIPVPDLFEELFGTTSMSSRSLEPLSTDDADDLCRDLAKFFLSSGQVAELAVLDPQCQVGPRGAGNVWGSSDSPSPVKAVSSLPILSDDSDNGDNDDQIIDENVHALCGSLSPTSRSSGCFDTSC